MTGQHLAGGRLPQTTTSEGATAEELGSLLPTLLGGPSSPPTRPRPAAMSSFGTRLAGDGPATAVAAAPARVCSAMLCQSQMVPKGLQLVSSADGQCILRQPAVLTVSPAAQSISRKLLSASTAIECQPSLSLMEHTASTNQAGACKRVLRPQAASLANTLCKTCQYRKAVTMPAAGKHASDHRS